MSVFVLALLTIMLIMATALETLSTPAGLEYLAANGKKSGVITTKSGLQYKVLEASSDPHAISPNATSKCHVHYRGKTIQGVEFDSSYKRHKPTMFSPNDVIRGWAEALLLMREGDKWQVVIPAELAYGKRSMGEHITPGSVLIFEMELVKVEVEAGVFSAVAGLLPKFIRDLPFGVWLFVVYFGYQLIGPEKKDGASSANAKQVPLSAVSGSEYNEEVFLDIQIGDAAPEKLTFELFSAHVPRTTSNFSHLCRGDMGTGTMGKPLAFKGSDFHRIIPGFMAQGGK
jgi:FKBP-type peptidyl-prolyl cis-trans isomerase FklB